MIAPVLRCWARPRDGSCAAKPNESVCAYCGLPMPAPDPQPVAAPPPAGTRPPLKNERVLYTLGSGPKRGRQRPAIIMRVLATRRSDLHLPVLVQVLCEPGDGLMPHACEAGYSASPLPWHWTREEDIPPCAST